MKYEIQGSNLPVVNIKLNRGESIYTQSGGMAWMDDGITMQTNMRGGLGKSFARMFTGESFFMATYQATKDEAQIAFASTFVGTIMPVELGYGHNLICQKDAFLCAEESVHLDTVFAKKFTAGLFGGEGFLLQKLSGRGMAFLEIDGDLIVKELGPNEIIKVDTGHVAAFEEQMQYDIEMVKGFKNILFGGEGLFLTTVRGPGKVYLQTMNVQSLAQRIIPFVPSGS